MGVQQYIIRGDVWTAHMQYYIILGNPVLYAWWYNFILGWYNWFFLEDAVHNFIIWALQWLIW